MSVLDFFEDIERGKLRDPLSIEYAGFVLQYQGSYVVREAGNYRLTRDGRRHLSGLRSQLAETLSSGFDETTDVDGYENSGSCASDVGQ